jgi:hypothetical protein
MMSIRGSSIVAHDAMVLDAAGDDKREMTNLKFVNEENQSRDKQK